MPTDIKGLFAMLEAGQARYVLVGGLALVLHGIDRLTADVDLAVDLAPEEALRPVALLGQDAVRLEPVDGLAVTVASIPHLIRLKEVAARPQDLADIERLRDIERRRNT